MNKWKWLALALMTVLSLLIEWAVPHDPAHGQWWTGIPAFWIGFGFAGCWILIFLAKTLGKRLVNREEDYYDSE